MNISKRSLLLLLVCALSFGLFSIPVSAVELDFSKVTATSYFYNFTNSGEKQVGSPVVWENNSTNVSHVVEKTNMAYSAQPYVQHRLMISNGDGGFLVQKGDTVRFIVEQLEYHIKLESQSGSSISGTSSTTGQFVKYNDISSVKVRLEYSDGSYSDYSELVKDENYFGEEAAELISFDFQVYGELPVKKVFLMVYINQKYWSSATPDDYFTITCTAKGNPFKIIGETISQESADIKGILGFVEKIKTGIDGVKARLDTAISAITDLPKNLWAMIEKGLKGLFVPSDDYLSELDNRWDSLLSDRFGAIYDVGDLVHDSWGNLTEADRTNSIIIPVVDLSSAGIPFSFGGYEVEIVPAKFSFFVEVLKKIISIIATCLFINGLLKRYDEVMGVET